MTPELLIDDADARGGGQRKKTLGIPSRETTLAQHNLRDAEGRFLHFSGDGIATERAWRWRGTPAQAKALRKVKPSARAFKTLVPVTVS